MNSSNNSKKSIKSFNKEVLAYYCPDKKPIFSNFTKNEIYKDGIYPICYKFIYDEHGIKFDVSIYFEYNDLQNVYQVEIVERVNEIKYAGIDCNGEDIDYIYGMSDTIYHPDNNHLSGYTIRNKDVGWYDINVSFTLSPLTIKEIYLVYTAIYKG